MDGLILVNKPQDITSHDVVKKIRKITGEQKVGHFGTLDPLATGILIIALGKATRFFSFYSGKDKAYTGELKFGYATDTYDSAGIPISKPMTKYPEKKLILKEIKKLTGKIIQEPPPFSAKKFKGKPLYFYARKNEPVKVPPENVIIHSFDLLSYSPPVMQFEVKCSSGTYIRSLVHDLGQNLGCGGHLTALCRTQCAGYSLEQCFSLKDIERSVSQLKISNVIFPLNRLLPEYSKLIIKNTALPAVLNGNLISPENIAKIEKSHTPSAAENELLFRVFSQKDEFIALAKKNTEKICFHPFLVLDSPSSIH